MQKEQQCKCPIIKNLCTFEEQQESQDDWSTASKMESESRDETGTKGIRLVGPRRTQVKNSLVKNPFCKPEKLPELD